MVSSYICNNYVLYIIIIYYIILYYFTTFYLHIITDMAYIRKFECISIRSAYAPQILNLIKPLHERSLRKKIYQ